ncbi:SDR family oxidoreductase [Nocardioides marmoriginsengisoli]|uniref:SDR family oxidoreductase n=1 Tax=Nocardioides marmoriginsengisoli TaxID=661483 RepID=A0A3N0CH35_9ACTN|nr:coniferyl-alcohol dehydrogenase [Nocardioides marmoriginsengisoli]RNL62762.1 SDR family oxidoreductase [Nocardioides marmoriginsengisoli]
MTSLKGKRFVVTGTASGVGDATARRLLAEGAEVISLDRNQPTAAVSRHITVDLADEASIDEAIAQLEGDFDGLLNVAGVPGTAPADVVIAVNALAVRHLTEALLDRLNGGSVVIVGSSAGYGWPRRLDAIRDLLSTDTYSDGLQWFKDNAPEGNAYTFSKEVTTVYAQMMGLGLVDLGVRINAVLPGPVETPILADFEESMGKETLDGVKDLLGRHATPEDIAKVIVFLASDEAGWINGQALAVDGGVSGALATGLFPDPQI